jgi:hypothetical protein
MNIGLIDIDGKNYPNLALMKISAYHKQKGDKVSFVNFGNYDIIYKSKVFTFTPDKITGFYDGNKIIRGGIGYKLYENLSDELEHILPDYNLYNCEHAYGFLTRGCIRKCPWCIVPIKEGKLKPASDISEFIGDKKSAVLMDNNVLASDYGLKQIEKIIDMKIKVDFNQGLDARIIAENKDIAKLLSKVKWLKSLRMACDQKSQMESIEKATSLLRKYGCKPQSYFVYVLVKDIPDAYERVMFCKKLKLDPFAQPYRDFENNKIDKQASRFARWVNHKAIFKTVEWKDYK